MQKTDFLIINLIKNYISSFEYCLDLNDSSNKSFKLLIDYLKEFDNNDYKNFYSFYLTLEKMAKKDVFFSQESSDEFSKLAISTNDSDKIKSLIKIQKSINYYNTQDGQLILTNNDAFRNIASHKIVIDKKFTKQYSDKNLDIYKDELEQALVVLESYKINFPFLPNLIIKYNAISETKGYLSLNSNNIGLIDSQISPATFIHEFTHFIDYLCSDNQSLYSFDFFHGNANPKLPKFSHFLFNIDKLSLSKAERHNNMIQAMKYYFNENVQSNDLTLGNLKPFLDKHINDNKTVNNMLKYIIGKDEKEVISLFSMISDYKDISYKKNKGENYFSLPHEKLARIAQCMLEESNDDIVNKGYNKYGFILPLGTERKKYVEKWTNVLEHKIGSYLNSKQSNILSTHNQNTKFFDMKDKIKLHRTAIQINGKNITPSLKM